MKKMFFIFGLLAFFSTHVPAVAQDTPADPVVTPEDIPLGTSDWLETLPVSPGTSLTSKAGKTEEALEQAVRFLKVSEVREGDGYRWIAGSGSARINGGGSFICGLNAYAPSPKFEVTIQESAKAQHPECMKLFNVPASSYVPVDITGKGMYAAAEGVYLIKFLTISSCQKSEIKGTDPRLGAKD